MVQTLHSRFRAAEEQLLNAFISGPHALSSFWQTWTALSQEFGVAMELQEVDAETRSLAGAVASRVAVLADNLLPLHVETESLFKTFEDRCCEVLSQADEQASSSLTVEASQPRNSNALAVSNFASDKLDALAHPWLLSNLHDPYPPSAIKVSIADSCGCTVKAVQQWFAEARSSIGWTTLSHSRFSGNRRATSQAAVRAYSGDDVGILPSDITGAFAAIKAKAYTYHSHLQVLGEQGCEVLSEQNLSGWSPGIPSSSEAWEVESATFDQETRPSPVLPTNSPSFFTNEADLDEEDTVPPPPIAGCKRRLDTSTDIEDGCELALPAMSRPSKRYRCMSPTTEATAMTPSKQALSLREGMQLSQPDMTRVPSAAHLMTRSSATTTSHPSSTVVTLTIPENTERMTCAVDPAPELRSSTPRKRRLSDAFVGNSPKRPRGLTPAPRRQAVSDPLPNALGPSGSEMHTLGEWLQSSFDLPYAAELGGFNSSLPCNLEVASFAEQLNEVTPPTSLVQFASECHVSDAELVSATPEGFDLSAYNSDATLASGFDFEHNYDVATSDGSSTSSPSSAGSYSELSDYELPDNINVDWTQDWSQFLNILDSLDPSPTSSQSSWPNLSSPCPTAADSTSSPSPDVITRTLFGADPSFSSDVLSDIGGRSSLHMPLQAFS